MIRILSNVRVKDGNIIPEGSNSSTPQAPEVIPPVLPPPSSTKPLVLQKVVRLKKSKTTSNGQQSLLKKSNPVPNTPQIPPPPPPASEANKLYIVKNGELKTIKKSNIANSGIILPIKAAESEAKTKFRPISCNFIVNNDIPGGIMTIDQYRSQVDTHRRQQMMQKAPADPVTVYKVIRPTDIDLESTVEFAQVIMKNKPGRKKGSTNRKPVDESSLLEPVPGSRTRSGRLSRPPRHIQRFYAKDNDGTGRIEELLPEEDFPESPPATKKNPKRFFERLKCDSCGKSYVNEKQLQQHIAVAHREESVDDNLRIDCFNYLLNKLKRMPKKLRGRIFLDEIEIFVKKLQKLMEKLIRRFDETCLKEFLNYSQVHMISKDLEAVLNVPAGQYHFNTEVIDDVQQENGNKSQGVEVGHANNVISGNFPEIGENNPERHLTANQHHPLEEEEDDPMDVDRLVLRGMNESAMCGFDDSSAAHDTQKDSFPDHMISLEDAVCGSATHANADNAEDVNMLSSEEDDLTTPKKDPHPSPSSRRRLKLKRVMKNLNKSSSFPPPDEIATDHHQVVMRGSASAIKDLSMELFRSPNIGNIRPGNDSMSNTHLN